MVRTLLGPEAGTLVPREPLQTPPRAPAHTVPRAGAYAGNRPKTVQNPRGFPAAPPASPLPAERLGPSGSVRVSPPGKQLRSFTC